MFNTSSNYCSLSSFLSINLFYLCYCWCIKTRKTFLIKLIYSCETYDKCFSWIDLKNPLVVKVKFTCLEKQHQELLIEEKLFPHRRFLRLIFLLQYSFMIFMSIDCRFFFFLFDGEKWSWTVLSIFRLLQTKRIHIYYRGPPILEQFVYYLQCLRKLEEKKLILFGILGLEVFSFLCKMKYGFWR